MSITVSSSGQSKITVTGGRGPRGFPGADAVAALTDLLDPFTGTTIPDGSNVQQALQSLETAHESLNSEVATIESDFAASSGSSLVGFIQSGTGAVAQTAQSKMRQIFHVDDFGADGTVSGDSAALKAAIAAAAGTWRPVILPARRFYWDGTAITDNYVRLWGQGMPTVNTVKTALVGGSIIEGKLIFTGKYIDLRDLGVDLGTGGSAADADGIKCTAASYNAGEWLHTQNIVALCKNKTSPYHALLFEGYKRHTGGNILGVHGYFNCVLKQRNVRLTSIETDTANETGVYIKSDSAWGQAGDIQIGMIRTKSADDFGIRVQSDSASLVNVQVGSYHGSDHDRTICVQVLDPNGSQSTNIYFGDVLSERSTTADFSILSQKSGGAVFNVGFGNLVAIDPAGKVVEASCEVGAAINQLHGGRVYASYPSGASQTTMDDAMFIGTGVNSTNFQSVEIVEAYGVGSKIGAINYQNNADPKSNILGAHRCKVIGAGRPLPGNLNQTLSGATATVSIADNADGGGASFARVTIAAAVTVTTFAPELTGATFALGHVLTIYNNNLTYSLTVNHNPAGGIINPSSSNIVIPPSGVASWAHVGGGAWSKLA